MAFRRRNGKYNARKVQTEDGSFMSKKELKRWTELKLQEEAGMIQDLRKQVKFVIIPAQREPDTIGARGGVHKGKLIEREAAYIADFVYQKDGETIVEDTKGFRTKDYVLKRKLMLWVHQIKIREI